MNAKRLQYGLLILVGQVCCLGPTNSLFGQPNYDETRIPEYSLPDPLLCRDGAKVETPEIWSQKRRKEILELFEKQVYGTVPDLGPFKKMKQVPTGVKGVVKSEKFSMHQYELKLANKQGSASIQVLVFLPLQASKDNPVPVFLGYNFFGNQTVAKNQEIAITKSWVRNRKGFGITKNVAGEKSRGASSSRWPIEEIVKRGYGVATVYYGDVDPDFDDGFQNGVHALEKAKSNQKIKSDNWGSIAAWAWGLSRVLDSFETVVGIDTKKVIVVGHSRLGKTALWTGAKDSRFAMAISNNSGCGGAALSRREFGETVKRINTVFPHWFCDNFTKFNDRVDELPVDQHMLIALMAPRPVYIASASEDRWADPKGEFLAGVHAASVYRLFGKKGISAERLPPTGKSIGDSIGYHLRKGKHDIQLSDWLKFMDFADRHLKK